MEEMGERLEDALNPDLCNPGFQEDPLGEELDKGSKKAPELEETPRIYDEQDVTERIDELRSGHHEDIATVRKNCEQQMQAMRNQHRQESDEARQRCDDQWRAMLARKAAQPSGSGLVSAQVIGGSQSLPSDRMGEGVNPSTPGVNPSIPRYHPLQSRVQTCTEGLVGTTSVLAPPVTDHLQSSTPKIEAGNVTELTSSDLHSGTIVRAQTAVSKKPGRQTTYGDYWIRDPCGTMGTGVRTNIPQSE